MPIVYSSVNRPLLNHQQVFSIWQRTPDLFSYKRHKWMQKFKRLFEDVVKRF